MIKLRYDITTGAVGNGYTENIEVPQPYLLITEAEHDKIKNDFNNYYFVEAGELVAREKMPIIRKEAFLKDFFATSLGYIRFKPTLKNGSQIDFISLLPQYKAIASVSGLPAGAFIFYREPDYTQDFTEEYLQSLQGLSPAMTLAEYQKFELEVTNAYQKAFFG
mgnify:CR=1 FL=1